MSGDTDSFVRLAAQVCLAACHGSPTPFTALSDSLEELRDRGWSEGAISAVAFIVSKSLHGNEILGCAAAESPRESPAVADASTQELGGRSESPSRSP